MSGKVPPDAEGVAAGHAGPATTPTQTWRPDGDSDSDGDTDGDSDTDTDTEQALRRVPAWTRPTPPTPMTPCHRSVMEGERLCGSFGAVHYGGGRTVAARSGDSAERSVRAAQGSREGWTGGYPNPVSPASSLLVARAAAGVPGAVTLVGGLDLAGLGVPERVFDAVARVASTVPAPGT